jgi:hypothetical protein
MADRTYGEVTLWLDDAQAPDEVRLRDPSGAEIGPFTVTQVYPGRSRALVMLPEVPRRDGLWAASWTLLGSEVARTSFTVGEHLGYGTPLQALAELAERWGPVWHGTAVSGTTNTVSEPALAYGGDVTGAFLLRVVGNEQGAARRVRGFDSGVLALERPFSTPVQGGERYLLLEVNPQNLLAALERALRTLGHTARVPLRAEHLAGEREVVVPEGWEAVSGVWVETPEGLLRVPPSRWRMAPGRRVVLSLGVSDLEGTGVTLEGFRSARPWAFWDSELDLDATVLSAQAAVELFLSYSGGPATDPEERLRKAVLSTQEAERLRLTRRSRVPHNARPVQP